MGTPIEKPDHCFHYIHLKSKSIRIWDIWVCNPISLSQSTPSKTATDPRRNDTTRRWSNAWAAWRWSSHSAFRGSHRPHVAGDLPLFGRWGLRDVMVVGCWLGMWHGDKPRVSVSFKVFNTWDFFLWFKSAEACLCCVELLHVAAWDEESPRFHGLNLDPKPIARLHMEKSHRKKFPKTWIIFPSTSTFFGFPKLSLFH